MKNRIKAASMALADVFNPMIPAFIVAGMSQGFANLLLLFCPQPDSVVAVGFIYRLLTLVYGSFTPFLTLWMGYFTSKTFGGTPILGGMIGMMTILSEIGYISSLLGLQSFLYPGVGGVIAAFIGALCFSKLEVFLRRHIPSTLNLVLTPLLAVLLTVCPYLLVVMPVSGAISTVLCHLMETVSSTDSFLLNIIAGYVCAAVFLPINVAGLQHGIIALYPIQLEKFGYITLYPVFAMAGAGQVGAGLGIWYLARKAHNTKLSNLAFSAAIPGSMGIAGPLIYTITLPLPKAFLASCLGAGFGGAVIKCFGIASTSWGPSGILALFMMDGPNGPVLAMATYLGGLLLSAITGFLFTLLLVKSSELKER